MPVSSDDTKWIPAAPAMRTVVIRWTEVSTHKVMVNVPTDVDLDALDLADSLAQLKHNGRRGLVREDIRTEGWGNMYNPNLEDFDPS